MSLSGALLLIWVATRVLFEFQSSPSAPYSITEFAPGQFIGATNNFTSSGNVVYQIDSAGNYKTIATLAGTNDIAYVGLMENRKLFGIWFDNRNTSQYFHLPRGGGAWEMLPNLSGMGIISQWPFGVWGPGGFFYAPFHSFIGRLDMSGNLETLYSFKAHEGAPNPYSNFAMTPDGTLYGENQSTNGTYFVYKLSPRGTLTKLADIPNTGGPWSPLVALDDGAVYGAESGGGSYKTGAIYKITPAGQFSIAAEFPASGLSHPSTLMVGADGNLYGSTSASPSAIFRVNTRSGKLDQVAPSSGGRFRCPCPMIQGSDGKLYGTSQTGGASGGGTIFSIDAGIPPPQPRLNRLTPAAGKVGAQVELWGSGLLGTGAVRFGGAPVPEKDISVPGPNVVLVHVPAGARSGPVQLRTISGSTVSAMPFIVR
jgi:uncharacterized repeat protein (TIGR03803 family)